MMRIALLEGGTAFITGPAGTSIVPSSEFTKADDDVVIGGPEWNMKIGTALNLICEDSGYSNVVILKNAMYFTDDPSAMLKIPKLAQIMWDVSMNEEARNKVDQAIITLEQYSEDDIWNEEIHINGTSHKASDYLDSIRFIRNTIIDNNQDATLKTMVCGRICMFEGFVRSMPGYITCLTPTDITEKLFRLQPKLQTENRER